MRDDLIYFKVDDFFVQFYEDTTGKATNTYALVDKVSSDSKGNLMLGRMHVLGANPLIALVRKYHRVDVWMLPDNDLKGEIKLRVVRMSYNGHQWMPLDLNRSEDDEEARAYEWVVLKGVAYDSMCDVDLDKAPDGIKEHFKNKGCRAQA